MVARRAWRAFGAMALSLSCAAISLGATSRTSHPLHTTLVQITYDAQGRVVEGSIRVFAGDLAAAVAKRAGTATPNDDRVTDAAAFAYVTNTFRLTDASGRMVPLAWCGSRRANDLLWLCVRATDASAPNTLKLSDQMLCELFDDQINIVQFAAGEKHASMLFTKGDASKSVF